MVTEENVYRYLSKVDSPADLHRFTLPELDLLAGEIRAEILKVVAQNGGHLASNLGVVELTIALHYVFHSPSDKLIWDVGHQGYVHKLLTGRRGLFRSLRQFHGCSGFLSMAESPDDIFGGGHAGTAISAALGMAAARDAHHGDEKIVAVVGDGSLNCGISLEGLNNVRETTRDLIIVLNDNRMSISPNVGAIPKYLNQIISGRGYNHFKAAAKMMLHKMPGGEEIRKRISKLEEATKSIFVPGVFFEELGIRYLGPVDGHNLPAMIHALEAARDTNRPVILHCFTEKGRGYTPAEAAPEKFHGLGAFNPLTGQCDAAPTKVTFSSAFGDAMLQLAEKHSDTVAVTAAMGAGTGLKPFAAKHPHRFYDAGIAEEHALVFAAGLAAGGLRPVVAIYSTFIQRALDCIYHDICLQRLPVIVCQDRSGVVEDGPTHHGIYDLAFLRQLPNLTIMQPGDEMELHDMLFTAYEMNAPVVIRYPKGSTGVEYLEDIPVRKLELGKAAEVRPGADGVIWALGAEVHTALQVAERLERERGWQLAVVNPRFVKPFDADLLKRQAAAMPVITLEDNCRTGGLAALAAEVLIDVPHRGVLSLGWGDEIIPHGAVRALREDAGLMPEQIAEKIVAFIQAHQAPKL